MKAQNLKFHIVAMTVLGLCFSGLALANDQVADPASSQAKDLLKKVDELYRSDSAFATMEMEVVTPNWQRTMSLQSWSKGMDDTFIRILSPKKDRGVATLKLEEEMWNYFPKINKVIKVPPSMMMGSWMGSDFTNDDLVKEVSLVEDYEVSLTETPTLYTLALIPKEGTVTVWEKIEVDVMRANLLPVEQRYFNEKGDLIRSMKFDIIRTFNGRTIPARMTMTPHNKPGNLTIIEYKEMVFDQPLPDDVFSLRNLQKRFK